MLKFFLPLLALLSINLTTLAFADQGMTSATHKKYVGKIVWSNQPVDFKKENESSFTEEFSSGDSIYGRMYFAKAINNNDAYYDGKSMGKISGGGYEIRAKIDNKPVAISFGVFYDSSLSSKSANQWTSIRFSPYPKEPKGVFATAIAENFTKAVRGLSSGKHKIEFELWGKQGQWYSENAMAKGQFTLDIKAGQQMASLTQFPQDKYSGSDTSEIKSNMKKALVSSVTDSASNILDLSIRSQWKHGVYNRLPRVEYRQITGVVLWNDTNNDNLCRFATYNYIQDKLSSGWTTLRYKSVCASCEEGEVDCPTQ